MCWIGTGITPGSLGNQSRRFPPSKADGAPFRYGSLGGDTGTEMNLILIRCRNHPRSDMNRSEKIV